MRTEPMNFEVFARPGPEPKKGRENREPPDKKDRGTGGGDPPDTAAALSWRVSPVGIVRTPFVTYCEPPKHFRRVGRGTIEVFEEFRDGLKDLQGFSHVWLLALLHQSRGHALLVRPPGSEKQRGLFATRSPRRPNPIGLSLVRLVKVDGCFIHVTGVDLLDGTPLLDIKPYLPAVDVAEGASGGWMADEGGRGEAADARIPSTPVAGPSGA